MRVALFVSCLADQLWPRAAEATVEVLRRAGCQVEFDPRQTCCGQPAFNSGYHDEARRVARGFVEVMSGSDAEAIVVPSGSCGAMVRRHLPGLFEAASGAGDRRFLDRARAVAAKTRELSDFLVNVLGVESVGGRFAGRIAWHDSCHALRDLGLGEEPRRLVRALGAELVELPAGAVCCGFGGSFSVTHPDLSVAMLDRRLEGLAALDVAAVASTDVGCLLQIEGRTRRAGGALGQIHALHLAELLVLDGELRR